jgi:hypothetical protein
MEQVISATMTRDNCRRHTGGGVASGKVVHSSVAHERGKVAKAISRQLLALASRARAVGLTDLSRQLETVAMEATARPSAGDEV